MGYWYDAYDMNVKIRKENFDKVIEKLKPYSEFTHVKKTVDDYICDLGYDSGFDEDGNLRFTYYDGYGTRDDEIRWLKDIASFVDAGSYISCRGEDGDIWQWYFTGDDMIEKAGRIVFD